MKVLAVLILAVFTGCNANLFYANDPELEVLTDAFWKYVEKVSRTVDHTLQTISSSQFGEDVRALGQHVGDGVNQRIEKIKPLVVDMREKLDPYVSYMQQKIGDYMFYLKYRGEELTEMFIKVLQTDIRSFNQQYLQTRLAGIYDYLFKPI